MHIGTEGEEDEIDIDDEVKDENEDNKIAKRTQ